MSITKARGGLPHRVDGNISNTDVSRARMFDKRGHFEDFDKRILREEAQMLIDCLARLGITSCDVPTADDLVEDFLARV